MDHQAASTFNDSVTTFDESMVNESPSAALAASSGFQITGLDVVTSDSDDDWSVESYANDSMEITKLRLAHARVEHIQTFEDASSLGYGSMGIADEDDWTVESYSNDSMVVNSRRLSLSAEQNHQQHPHQLSAQQPQQAAPHSNHIKQQPVLLARITRRRASMGDFVHQEQNSPVQQVQPTRSTPRRRMSMSSMSTIRSEESLSTQGSGNSENPAGPSDGSSSTAGSKKKKTIVRHKSMPYVKSAPLTNMVPLWPGEEERPRMERRVSNGGCPSAA